MGNLVIKTRKNNSIEFFRFLFMAILIAWHGRFGFFAHGYLVVEFFFILSGYFIYQSFYRKQKNTLSYVGCRIRRTYLEYSIACLCMFCISILSTYYNGKDASVLNSILKLISELLLLQNIGIFDGGFNYPLWYFSVLIWGGGGLYSLLQYNRKLTVNIILPIFILSFYTYIFGKQKSIEYLEMNIFYIPMLRGLADMSIGIMMARLFSHILSIEGRYLKFFNIFALLSFILSIIVITLPETHDKYFLIFIPILLWNSLNEKGLIYKIFNHNIFSALGGITFEMYLLHAAILRLLSHVFSNSVLVINKVLLYIIYLTIIIVISYAFKYVCSKIRMKFLRI